MERHFNGIRFKKVQDEKWYEWLSDAIAIPYLENKELRIYLEFDDTELDQFQKEIDITVKNALRLNANHRKQTKPHLFAYYKDVVLVIGEEQLEEMPPLKTDEDIFNYVNLTRLSIGKGSVVGNFYANFSGNCDWDIEHGVSISFLWGEEIAMVSSISHICNSDAYADKDKDQYIYIGSNIKTTLA
ncbi:MAG: hypothetical protein HC799_19635 [Limnothrix sp. RL_2_0]|nr:hypothetical protein [Limnothrix sp. RL_2_0]